MAKVKGPLLSMKARGQIGQAQIYASWKGIPYAKQYAIPSNPNTAAQQAIRNPFAWLQASYRELPSIAQEPWIAYAEGRPFTPRNGFSKTNLSDMNNASNIDTLRGSPGTRAAPGFSSLALTAGPGSGQFQYTLTPGPLPTGWSIVRAVVTALMQQDPQSDFIGPWLIDTVNAPGPYTDTITGTASTTYIVNAWLELERPDGRRAHTPSQSGQVTTPA